MFRFQRGFTLIELLVVIAIIGILSSIVMVGLGSARAKARDAKRVADVKNIQLALSLYYNDNLMYPKNIYAAAGTAPNGGLAPYYLPTVPTDPSQSGSCTGSESACYRYVGLTTSASPACNATTNIVSKYHIATVLEDSNNSGLVGDVDAPLQTIGTTGFQPCTSSGTGDFNGLTTNCTATANATDQCYDQMP